jgi:hypothetical protein
VGVDPQSALLVAALLRRDERSWAEWKRLRAGEATPAERRLLTLVYEQGLTVATNALRLEYTLSRTLTLRLEAGTISGFGIFYRRSYD